MTIKNLLTFAKEKLKKSSETFSIDSELLLAFVLKKERTYLFAYPEEAVSPEQKKLFLKFISQRIKGCPVAYLTNRREFYGLPFYVNKDVLIPRMETEQLVDLVFEEVKKKSKKEVSIVDIGTGSGCIAIALLKRIIDEKLNNTTRFTIFFVDKSKYALNVAQRNFIELIPLYKNMRAQFVQSDLLQELEGKFDIIVSNPPYIPSNDIEKLQVDIKDYEPRLALDGGEQGFQIIERMLDESKGKLKKRGVIFLELHETHSLIVRDLIRDNMPLYRVNFIRDFAGIERFAKIEKI
jgi:release factor glutamine methyltransferase